MKIAIWGGGNYGSFLENELKNYEIFQVCYFVDNDLNKIKIKGVPVFSPLELKYRYENNEIDAVLIAISNYYSIGDVLLQLHELGIYKVFVADPELWKKHLLLEDIDIYDYIQEFDISTKAVLTKLEYHVCDACNLNCKGCSHFAPIFTNGNAMVDEFERDVKQLSKKFANILRFRLMGGEPFLHKELDIFVNIVRYYFPYTRLEIVTNGLLLDKVEQRIWDAIIKNNVVLNISLYPPTFAKKDKIEELVSNKGVHFTFGSGLEQYNDSGIIEEFHKNFTSNKIHSPYVSAKRCMGSKCHYLRNGKISKCALPLLVPYINDYFHTEYSVSSEDYIDIYDEQMSSWDMFKRLYFSTPFCGYCAEDGCIRFDWSAHDRPNLSDYIVQ